MNGDDGILYAITTRLYLYTSRRWPMRMTRTIRRRIMPFAEARGLLTDEDVFKAITERRP